MILLSNLIKSSSYKTTSDRRHIDILEIAAPVQQANAAYSREELAQMKETAQQTAEMRNQILQDAEEMAERRIADAQAQAEQIQIQARAEIEEWWNAQRVQDEAVIAEAKQQAYNDGFAEGQQAGEAHAIEQYASMIAEAQHIIQQATEQKQFIIKESEPFILELSCEIARKIITKELTASPEWISEMIKKVLARRREQRTVTLCVSPQYYSFLLDSKEDLRQVIDSQAELIIVPDHTITDEGCVVRTEFGSLDARIDTQLTEIRTALLQVAQADTEPSE